MSDSTPKGWDSISAGHETRRGRTFEEWRKVVNAEVVRRVGVDIDDLPNTDLYTWWSDGLPTVSAARRVIRNAQEDML